MKKGTILYVGNFELPDKGASANRVVSNGKIFESLGYQVVYLGVSKGLEEKKIHLLDKASTMYEEPYPRGSKEWLLHMCSTKHIQEMVSIYEDTCMIILYNVPFALLCNVKRIFKKRDIKVVYDCTEWTGVTDGSFVKRLVKRMDEYFIRNHIGRVADGLIVISKMMEQQYKKKDTLIRIPPLVNIDDAIWHQTPYEKTAKYEFCFAGMLDGKKDSLNKIVEAFSQLPSSQAMLRIIGVDEPEFLTYYPELRDALEKCNNQILFMGRLSHKETIRYVLGCDCYIFIRQSDRRNNAGFPTKFAECYTCGMPIIATDISDLLDYMRETDGWLLSAISADDIRLAMHNELENCRLFLNDKKEQQKGVIKRTLRQDFHYMTYKEACRLWLDKMGC